MVSEFRSGQAPLHRGKPLLVHLQAPEEQVEPAGHAVPHFPQFMLSEFRSGQAPLHGGKPLLVHLQAPEEQVEPAGQALPHVPQL